MLLLKLFIFIVAGPGIAPGPGGYAYQLQFSLLCQHDRFVVWTIPSSFIGIDEWEANRLVSTPSLQLLSELGSVLPH